MAFEINVDQILDAEVVEFIVGVVSNMTEDDKGEAFEDRFDAMKEFEHLSRVLFLEDIELMIVDGDVDRLSEEMMVLNIAHAYAESLSDEEFSDVLARNFDQAKECVRLLETED